MTMASKLEGRKIVALTQGPDDRVIVFNVQIVRLAQMVRLIET